MSQNFQVIQLVVDDEALKKAGNRTRNQLVGCMHAHNELAVLNRLLLFSMNDTGEGDLHDARGSYELGSTVDREGAHAGGVRATHRGWRQAGPRNEAALRQRGGGHQGEKEWQESAVHDGLRGRAVNRESGFGSRESDHEFHRVG